MNLKILYLSGFLILLAEGAVAQSYLGFHAGLNSGKFSGDSPRDFRYVGKLQLNAGLDFDLRLKNDLFLSISPSYLNTGSKLQYPFEIDEEENEWRDSIDLKLQMFSIPIYLKIISNNERWQFSGGLELTIPVQLLADNSVEENDITGDINKMGISMDFGIGYRIPIDKSILIINLGYSQGLTNLAKNLNDPDSLLPRIRLSSFRLTAIFMLPLGKKTDK